MDIKVKISAVLANDLDTVLFQPMVAATKRARGRMAAELKGAFQDASKGNEQAAAIRARLAMERQAAREVAQLNRERFREAAANRQSAYRQELAHQRELAREERRRQESSSRQMANRAMSTVVSSSRSAVHRGVGIAGDVARGAGISLDTAGMIRNFVTRERMATDLSNSAFQAGAKGPAGTRQSPVQLLQEASGLAQETGLDPTRLLEGMQKFVAKTGDLQGARDSLKELAILSQATGTDIADMVDAAGDAFANLGDKFASGEEKARAVVDVMKALSGQGKIGAVEIKDMAVQMAGLASLAGSFQGDRVQNMAVLGAIAQESRQRGGAKSASQAVNSVQGLMGIFGKKARLKELDKMGVNVFSDSSKTQINDIQTVLTSALSKSKGSIPALSKMFMDVQAQRAVRGFASVYTEEYRAAKRVKGTTDEQADAKAVAAVNAEFARLKGATLKESEIRESFAAKMKTAEVKAQNFQNQLQTITDKMATKLLPELERLGPTVTSAVGNMSNMVTWASKNPYQATGAVVGVAVLKAGTEAVIGKAIEGGVSRAMAGGFGSLLGAGGLSIAAAAVTLYALHELNVIDEERKKGASESTEEGLATARRIENDYKMERGKEQAGQFELDQEMSKPEKSRDEKKIKELQNKIETARKRQQELQEAAKDIFNQLSGDLDNKNNVDKKGKDNLLGTSAESWITSIRKSLGLETNGNISRKDVADAEATGKRLDEVKAAVDGLGTILNGGLTIKSLPTSSPNLTLPDNVTGP